jgi:primary-amine oxidase
MPDQPMTMRGAAASHPLAPLSFDEGQRSVAIVREQAGLSGAIRFASLDVIEPDKAALGGSAAPPRRTRAIIMDLAAKATVEAVIDLDAGRCVSVRALPGVQAGIALDEFTLCEQVVKADPAWQAALARRGILDLGSAIVDPWSAGAYGDERYPDRRMVQALTWIRGSAQDVGYGRPVEGLIAWVDLATLEVVEVVDERQVPLPPLSGAYTADAVGPLRTDLKPLDIVQPDGPSFTVDGYEVRWQKWRLRVGWTAREGLVLHEIGYEDQGRVRPVIHRASLSEMQVPYGDPTPTHNKKNVFDVGEYGIGVMANSLALGCDCLGTIHYFDAHMVNMGGEAWTLPNAICLHEEDDGTLWKHTDWRNRHTEVRRSRRLVISFFATVGNYDYGFYWYFTQTGEVHLEVKLTGCLSVGAYPPGEYPVHGALVAPQLYAPIHQHYFSIRLDMDVDGVANAIYEVDSVSEPEGEPNPYGTSFRPRYTLLHRESEGARDAAPAIGRSWMVVNPNRRNAVGRPPGYKIVPGADTARPLARPESSLMQRGGFIGHTLWATAYDPGQLFAAGEFINQNPARDGLPKWIEADRSLENADLVVWYTIGVHHIPRPEDWPVMPVARAGFMLKPAGFFDRNPAMDVPPPQLRHSCCA